jgi:hypothetical protein
MAKHRRADRRARARTPTPAHTVDMVDLGTGTSHLLTPDATADPTVATPRYAGWTCCPRRWSIRERATAGTADPASRVRGRGDAAMVRATP